ncbi:MAG: hypothetical protein HKO67_10080 [Flavobacteriaceae bacterium]|nr:hypothetical protein [Flavobacteriaceae bacterium]
MEKGNTSKYLKYAIGEILLVVIGILIALQINNWNEAKKTRRKEVVLLHQLKEEFKANLEQLDNKMIMRNAVIKSSKFLLEAIDNRSKPSQDSIEKHLKTTLYTPTFNSNTNDYFASRDINLIQNDSLKNLLSKWPTKVDELNEEEILLVNHRENRYIPFLATHIQIRDLFHQVELDIGMKDLIYPKEGKPLDLIIGESIQSKSYYKLLQTEELEEYLSYTILFNNISQTQSVPLKDHIYTILDQIQKSLEHYQ